MKTSYDYTGNINSTTRFQQYENNLKLENREKGLLMFLKKTIALGFEPPNCDGVLKTMLMGF